MPPRLSALTLLTLCAASGAAAQDAGAPRAALASTWRTTVIRETPSQKGIASYYWQPQMTASGEVFDPAGLTAAHPSLPFDTKVKVTEVASGRSVVVRINDRGPFTGGRVIDISEKAAQVLGFTGRGTAMVRLEVMPGE
jgi:rare lipoprotein A (peptidoglycan hydrolase)